MLDFLKSKMYFPTFKPNKWEMRERRRRQYFWSKNECGDFLLSRIQLFSCFRFCFSFHLLFLFIVHDIVAVVVLWGGMLHLTNQHFDYGESLEFFITSCTRQTKKRDHQVPTDNAVGELFSESVIILTFLSYFYQIHWEVGEYLSLCCSTPILTKNFAISRAYSWKEIGHWSALSIPNKHIHCIYTVPVSLLYVYT